MLTQRKGSGEPEAGRGKVWSEATCEARRTLDGSSSEPSADSSLDPPKTQTLSTPGFSLRAKRITPVAFQSLRLYYAMAALENINSI